MEPRHEFRPDYRSDDRPGSGPGGPEPVNRPEPVAMPDPAALPAPKDAMPRARTGLLLLIAFLTELVVIAAADNQWVAKKIAQGIGSSSRLVEGLRAVGLVYQWRFTPQSGDSEHFWAGSLALIGTTFVISVLLILAVIRGPVSFGRAFFGCWMSVVVATMIGGYVRGVIVDINAPDQGNRAVRALFGVLAPSSVTFLGGVGLGLIVAIVVGILAPATRRKPRMLTEPGRVPAGAVGAEPGGGFFEPTDRPAAGGGPNLSSRERQDDAPTTALPSFDKPAQRDESPWGVGAAGAAGGAAGAAGGASAAHEADVAHTPEHGADAPTAAHTPAQDADAPTAAHGTPTSAHGDSTDPADASTSAFPAQRQYGDAPDSPYSVPRSEPRSDYAPPAEEINAGAARSPAQEQSGIGQAPAEPTGGPQGTAELPRLDDAAAPADPHAHSSEFPRPPDDEDLGDIEHR